VHGDQHQAEAGQARRSQFLPRNCCPSELTEHSALLRARVLTRRLLWHSSRLQPRPTTRWPAETLNEVNPRGTSSAPSKTRQSATYGFRLRRRPPPRRRRLRCSGGRLPSSAVNLTFWFVEKHSFFIYYFIIIVTRKSRGSFGANKPLQVQTGILIDTLKYAYSVMAYSLFQTVRSWTFGWTALGRLFETVR